jgi:hypothetical protein
MSLESRLRTFRVDVRGIDVDEAVHTTYRKARRVRALHLFEGVGAVAVVIAAAIFIPSRVAGRQDKPIAPASILASPSAPLSAHVSAIVFARSRYIDGATPEQEDIWVYDIAADRQRRLTTSGAKETEALPRFRSGEEFSFVVRRVGGTPSNPQIRESIHLMNIATGVRREIATFEGQEIIECRWSGDGKSLALVLRNVASGESHSLHVLDLGSGKVRVVAVLGPISGRGAGLDDEVSLTWSRDDSALLVVDTFLQSKESILLVDVGSGKATLAISGTNASLSPNERYLYFRELESEPGNPARWFEMEIATRSRSLLDATPGSHRAALSRDGRYLVHVYGENPPEMLLYLYDLRTRTEKLIGRGFLDPAWLTPDTLIATSIKSCTTIGCDGPRMATGTARVSISGRSKLANLDSTLQPNTDVSYR